MELTQEEAITLQVILGSRLREWRDSEPLTPDEVQYVESLQRLHQRLVLCAKGVRSNNGHNYGSQQQASRSKY